MMWDQGRPSAVCANWVRALEDRTLPWPFPSAAFQLRCPAGFCLDFGQGIVPSGTGCKQSTQEGCNRALAVGPSKGLQMEKRARNWIHSFLQARQQAERFFLTIQDTSQDQSADAEKMQPLHFAADSGRGWAVDDGALDTRGELCAASLLSIDGVPQCLFIPLACSFHFLLGKRGGKLPEFFLLADLISE